MNVYDDTMAKVADLQARLKEAERERDELQRQKLNAVDWETLAVRQGMQMKLREAENAALKQKLEAVREWVKLYDPDWDNDINKLEKILEGE